MVDFFSFWVEGIWGSALVSLIGTACMYAILGVMGRMSYTLISIMLGLYFIIFGIGFFGMIFWLPIFIFAMIYFFLQAYKFVQGYGA